MSGKKRILLTGAAGYIGSAIGLDLEAAGFEVVGVSRRGSPDATSERAMVESTDPASAGAGTNSPEGLRSDYQSAQRVVCDLSDAEATARALAQITPCDAIIHTASRTDSAYSAIAASTGMLQNLYQATRHWQARWIHLSSVSVYGDDRRQQRVRVTDTLRPATNYGRSKLKCEQFLQNCGFADCRILRITPVYSPNALRNIAVRVYLPGTPIRMKIRPEPRHSLCSLDRLVSIVRGHVLDARSRSITEHATDAADYGQNELAGRFAAGPILTIPEVLFRPMYRMLCWIPGNTAYQMRSMYWKLFRSNLYEPPPIEPSSGILESR